VSRAAAVAAAALAGLTGRALAAGATAREEAALLARAGEAKYRLARLRSREGGPAGGPELGEALRDLEEARALDPANLAALAWLGLARLEAAKRDGPRALDREGFDSAREPLEELFRLSRGWADPATRGILKDVLRALDDALAGEGVRPGGEPRSIVLRGEAAAWWSSWREEVARAAEGGQPVRDVLATIEALRSAPASWERERAVEELAKMEPAPPEAAAELARALREDGSPWVRAAAARALAALRPEGWDVRLAETLRNDESVWVRRTCARRLHALSGPGRSIGLPPAARAALIEALEADTPRVASAAAVTLGAFPDTDDALIRALRSPSSLVRSSAATGLARWGKPPEELIALLNDTRSEVRSAAVRTFSRFTGFHVWDEEVRSQLVGLLEDPDPEVRWWAVLALSWDIEDAGRERFVALLEDGDARVRFFAALALLMADRGDQAGLAVIDSLSGCPVPLCEGGDAGLVTIGDLVESILSERERKSAP
jgi:HEAT repeat protein